MYSFYKNKSTTVMIDIRYKSNLHPKNDPDRVPPIDDID